MKDKYDSIINLPHHISATRPQMSISDRAAQFSPFAALTGYDEAVRETARLTEFRHELDEAEKAEIDIQLQYILIHITENPIISVKYFIPDTKKNGGRYITVSCSVQSINTYDHLITLTDGHIIPIDDILSISLI